MGLLDRLLREKDDPEIPTEDWVMEAYYEYTRRLEKQRRFRQMLNEKIGKVYDDLGVKQP